MVEFNTTLTADMGAADLIISVADNTGAPTTYPARFFIDETECVYVNGGVAEGLDWDISRAREGSDAVEHFIGAGVRFVPGGPGTEIVIYSGAFDTALVQTTASGVTAQANDGAGDMAAKLFLGTDGAVTLEGAVGAGALTIAADGTTTIAGDALSFFVGADGGDDGQVLVAQPSTNNVAWQFLVTVQTGAPGGTYVTPFIFDDTATTGGLYAWNGSAYVLIGLATT